MKTEVPYFRFDANRSGRAPLEPLDDFPMAAAEARQRV